MPIDLIFDMETGDPDDLFTLMFLTAHPEVRLRAVTIMPGTRAQVGVVRWVLRETHHEMIPIGSFNANEPRDSVSRFLAWIARDSAPEDPDDEGFEVLADALWDYPDATVLTGAPLGNLGRMLKNVPDARIARWIGQGGFAGDNVVPARHRLPKFAGKVTCKTYNFNLDAPAAFAMLESDRVGERRLVSKNVCHGVVYDEALHLRMKPFRDSAPGFRLMVDSMAEYLKGQPGGKKFHDPLAACVAIDPEVCEFAEVELYQEGYEWGSRPKPDSGTWISTAVNFQRFVATLQGKGREG